MISFFNTLNKWLITSKIDFIGHEHCMNDSIFTVMKCKEYTFHIEYYQLEDFTVICCYKNKETILNFSSKNLELCLFEINKLCEKTN